MPATPNVLFQYLDRLRITTVTVGHPPLFSVAQSRLLRGEIPGVHTKNLFLVDRKSHLFLVVAEENVAIDLKRLHKVLHASGKLSFGKADTLLETLGVEPGSVTPFAVINDQENRVTVVIDKPLLTYDLLNFHPLLNTMTTRIGSADLLRFLQATDHLPRIIAVSESLKESP
jgi:Ala-tRNA(Pro) deacylase